MINKNVFSFFSSKKATYEKNMLRNNNEKSNKLSSPSGIIW